MTASSRLSTHGLNKSSMPNSANWFAINPSLVSKNNNKNTSMLDSMGKYGGGAAGTDSSGGIGGFLSSLMGSSSDKGAAPTEGWAGAAASGMGSLFNLYSGMKEFGLAQDQFDEAKRQYNQNYNAEVKSYNTNLEDRQAARVAANPGAYQSVSEYMNKNRQV